MGKTTYHVQAITPGELLEEEFLKPLKISKYRLAKDTGMTATRVGQIVAGKRSITADTDLRLCKYFGLSDGYWLRAQAHYDTQIAKAKIADQLKQIKPYAAAI